MLYASISLLLSRPSQSKWHCFKHFPSNAYKKHTCLKFPNWFCWETPLYYEMTAYRKCEIFGMGNLIETKSKHAMKLIGTYFVGYYIRLRGVHGIQSQVGCYQRNHDFLSWRSRFLNKLHDYTTSQIASSCWHNVIIIKSQWSVAKVELSGTIACRCSRLY